MSPEQLPLLPSGSRLAALLDSRRWLLVLLLSEAWVFAAIVGATQWRRLASGDRLALGLGLVLLIAGWLLSRRPVGLWLIAAAPALLVIATLLNNGDPTVAAWIALSTSAAHVSYALVLLTPRWVGLASIPLLSAVLAVDWAHRPTNVFPGALAVAGGWIAVASLTFSALALWFAWHYLERQDVTADESTARLSARMSHELETQERSRMWREAAIAVHERLLSTIRYLLQSRDPDRAALRAFIASGDVLDAVASQTDLTHSVRVSTAARIASGIVTLDPTMIDLPLDEVTRAAGRAAVVECALNAVLHGGATEVIARGSMDGDRVRVTVSDNGSGLPADAAPGLGWRTVLDEGLAAVGGTWSIARVGELTVVTIDVPSAMQRSTASLTDDGFRQGRTLLSAPLIAVGAVGVALDIAALHASTLGWLAILIATLASVGGVVLIVRGRPPLMWQSLIVIAGFASIPWLTALVPGIHESVSFVVPGLVTAGYSVIAVALWARRWQFIAGLAIWAAGMLAIASHAATADRLPLFVGLINCLVIVPVVVIVSSRASVRFRRTQELLKAQLEAMTRAVLRANAATLVDSQLSACVAQAESIIRAIAAGDSIDEHRHQLDCLEGLIRATIQVDPVDGGEFARSASRLVTSAFSIGVPAQVGTLISSTDRTPLPSDILVAIERLVTVCTRITVRVTHASSYDYLSVQFEHAQDAYLNFNDLHTNAHDGLTIDIEPDPESGTLLVVSRPAKDPALS